MIKQLDIFPSYDALGRMVFTVRAASKDLSYSVSAPSELFPGPHAPKNAAPESAMRIFSDIKENFIGLDETDWENIDTVIEQLNRTPDFRKTGANLAFSISMACAGTASFLGPRALQGPKPSLPLPIFTVAGGGRHGGEPKWEEFILIPKGVKTTLDAAHLCMEAYTALGEEFSSRNALMGRNLRNAWAARLDDYNVLDIVSRVADDWKLSVGVNFGAQANWKGNKYNDKLGTEGRVEAIIELAGNYKLAYIEDPFHADDFPSMKELEADLKGRCLLAGQEIYASDPERVEIGIETKACDCVVIKPAESGTLSRMFRASRAAAKAKMNVAASVGGVETADPWLADLAVAMGAKLMKTGPAGSEMLAKVNRLIELEKSIPGAKLVSPWSR